MRFGHLHLESVHSVVSAERETDDTAEIKDQCVVSRPSADGAERRNGNRLGYEEEQRKHCRHHSQAGGVFFAYDVAHNDRDQVSSSELQDPVNDHPYLSRYTL